MTRLSPAWATLALTIVAHVVGLAVLGGILWQRSDLGPIEERVERVDDRVIELDKAVARRFDRLEGLIFELTLISAELPNTRGSE